MKIPDPHRAQSGERPLGSKDINCPPREGLAAGKATNVVPRLNRSTPYISVIMPIYNEEENVSLMARALFSVLDEMNIRFEIICVNDGSTDASLTRLREVAAERKEFKIVDFRRNYGQTAAIMAGIDYAGGEIIVSLDADLQNDPEDIPRLIAKLQEGNDVVSGWRQDRTETAVGRKFLSRAANRAISFISGVRLNDYGCTLKAYKRDVIKGVRLYGEMHRFIPIYASWMGATVTQIPVRHHTRRFGSSNYGVERVVKVILDLIVVKFLDRYYAKPIYVFGGFGFLSIALGVLVGLYALYLRLFQGISFIVTPLPLLTVLLLLIGVISILLGLIAEIQVRTYFESQQRSVYLVRNEYNFDAAD
jgi:glycosyltransferase involved in cell wall biosynthesis